ncbi:MAG: hypothetical protein AB198_00730 [Parcubacteria bacterium C7867-003]|nr:MAG: hypothetical protein AB198_00730 [Parcubacteria bacterium C7867-003]
MKKLKNFINVLSTVLTFFPGLVYAQNFVLSISNIRDFIFYLVRLLSLLNPVLFSLAFVVFFWGLSKSILNSGNKDEIQKGREYMLWGIVALFVLISFRVLISFISSSIGLGNSTGVPLIRLFP